MTLSKPTYTVYPGKENEIKFGGFLGKDPEVFETRTGMKIVTLSMGQTKKTKTPTGESKKTIWMQVKFFNNTDALALKKGDNVTVEGRIDQQTWLDKESGKERAKIEIIGSSFKKNPYQPNIAAAPDATDQVNKIFNEFDESSIPF